MKNSGLMAFLAVLLVVLLRSHYPALRLGYGGDPDSWRVAAAARDMAATHTYTVSRLPGNPLHEMGCALLARGGPVALNGASLAFTALAAGLFSLLLRQLGVRYYALGGLALVSVPVVFVAASITIDYNWALAFLVGAVYAATLGSPVIAGVSLGLATGCRLTSYAAVLPVAMVLWRQLPARRTRAVLLMAVTGLLLASLSFAPVIAAYGWGFIPLHVAWRPPLPVLLRFMFLGPWGRLGVLALVLAAAVIVTRRGVRPNSFSSAWLAGILVFHLLFIRLPLEPSYLIPAIPFVLLFLGTRLAPALFALVSVLLCLSPFLTVGAHGFHPGPGVQARRERVEQVKTVDAIRLSASAATVPSVVVAGEWLPVCDAGGFLATNEAVEFVYLVDARQFGALRHAGKRVYYLPDVPAANLRQTGLDLQASGASPFPLQFAAKHGPSPRRN